jgi:hypothetical protein
MHHSVRSAGHQLHLTCKTCMLQAFQIMLGNQPAAVAVPQCLCYALGAIAWSCSTQSSAAVQQVLLRTAGVASAGTSGHMGWMTA